MLAIQYGAGNIGRGFIGCLLHESGYEVVFADVIQDIIDQINNLGQYKVHVKDVKTDEILVDNVRAINSMEDKILDEIAKADIITTAVGVNILDKIAPTIAKGISHKNALGNTNSLNIIACENAVMATSKLKEFVYSYLNENDRAFADSYIGFANCSVDRIVPPVSDVDGIDVCVENYYEWNVCKDELIGNIKIDGINLVDNLESYIERKLFTLNTGHAITAYLGFINDYEYIDQAINDEKIYEIIKNAMNESGKALVKKYGFDENSHNCYIDKIINRFKNPYLKDDVTRVGRQPLRKLSIEDRLVKPMLTAYEYDMPVDNLLIGIAAALQFNNPEDEECVEMQNKISSYGLRSAIVDITGIQDKFLLDKIEENYYSFLED